MTPGEVSALLAIIADMWATLTPRTPEDAQLRAANWHASLDHDCPHDFAVRVVHKHFGRPGSEEPTPGDINAAWRAHKRDKSHERQMRQITATNGVPPTPEFYAAWREMREKRNA